MCLAQGPQGSDAGDARTGGPFVSMPSTLPLNYRAPYFQPSGILTSVDSDEPVQKL